MKINSIIKLFTILFLGIMNNIDACLAQRVIKGIKTETYCIKEISKFKEEGSATCRAISFDGTFEFMANSNTIDIHDNINKNILDAINPTGENSNDFKYSINKWIKTSIGNYLQKEYQRDNINLNLTSNDCNESIIKFEYEESHTIKLIDTHLSYITFKYDVMKGNPETFSYETFYRCYDAFNGKLIIKEDVFLPNSDSAISKLIFLSLGFKVNNTKFDEVLPLNNFRINKEGIVFVINKGTCNLSKLGQVNVLVSFKELQDLMHAL